MPWFQKLCRNMGLAVHNVAKPIKDDAAQQPKTKEISREVKEEQVDENITLRRTTIEEIEMKPGADETKLKGADNTDESQ